MCDAPQRNEGVCWDKVSNWGTGSGQMSTSQNGSRVAYSQVARSLKFTYPFLLRVVLGVGGIAFLASALWASLFAEKVGTWVPLGLLAFGVLDMILWYHLSGEIYLDAEAISFRRFGRTVRIRYEDVIGIEDRVASQRLIIRSPSRKIVIEKQLRDYSVFYSLLMELCPRRTSWGYPTEFPIIVHVQRWVWVVWWLSLVAGVIVILLGIQCSFEAIVFGLLIISVWVIGFFAPRAYVFDWSGLTIIYLGRRKVFPLNELLDINLRRRWNSNTLAESSELELIFVRGKVVLREEVVDYSLERLMAVLSRHYPRDAVTPGRDAISGTG